MTQPGTLVMSIRNRIQEMPAMAIVGKKHTGGDKSFGDKELTVLYF